MTHEIIEELEAKLADLQQDCQSLERTIAYLRSLGYGVGENKELAPPIVRPRPGQGTGKPKHGQFTASIKAAIESLGGKQFTLKDVGPLLPETAQKKNLATRLPQLAEAGYLIRISKGSPGKTRPPAVYQRPQPDKPIRQFSPMQKEKARAAFEKHGFAQFICEGCAQSFQKCPEKCPKCSGRSFEELELGKDD